MQHYSQNDVAALLLPVLLLCIAPATMLLCIIPTTFVCADDVAVLLLLLLLPLLLLPLLLLPRPRCPCCRPAPPRSCCPCCHFSRVTPAALLL